MAGEEAWGIIKDVHKMILLGYLVKFNCYEIIHKNKLRYQWFKIFLEVEVVVFSKVLQRCTSDDNN